MCSKSTLCDLFDEDIVVHFNHKKNSNLEFGLVIESSENATSDEDSDDSDTDSSTNTKWRKIKQGFAKIAWYPNGDTQVLSEDKVTLYDRSLLAGDVVQRIDSNTNQILENGEHGYCKSAKIFATIKILGTDKVIENIDCENIEMLSRITADTVCVLDSWIGYVKDVNYSITLKCNDGSLLIAKDEQLDDFCDLLTQRDNDNSEFNRSDFYIGQQLYGPKKHLKHCFWIIKNSHTKAFLCSDSPKHSKIKLAVNDISIDSVSINWICCISDESGAKKRLLNTNSDQSVNDSTHLSKMVSNKSGASGLHAPNQSVTGEAIQRIKCLNYFAHSSLQIGHQCYYTIRQNDTIVNFSDWKLNETNKFSSLKKNLINSNFNDNKDTANRCDKLFVGELQSCSLESESTETESLTSFKCDKTKTKKKRKIRRSGRFAISLEQIKKKKLRASHRKRECNLPIDIKPGSRFPVEIISTHTNVTVIWQNGANEENLSSTNLYPVHHIDDHDFFPGDFVVENKDFIEPFCYGVVQSSDFISRVASVKWFNASQSGSNNLPVHVAQRDVSVYDIKDHPDFNFRPACCVIRIPNDDEDGNDLLSRAGQIVDITRDGLLKCVWSNGRSSLVYPFNLFVIGDYDSDDLWDDSDDELGYDYSTGSCCSSESWETESEQTTDDNQNSINKNSKHKSKNKSVSRNSSHANSHALSYELLNILYNGATQIEEWLRNGTGNYLKNFTMFQNAIKSFKADLTEESNRQTNDESQNEKITHSNSKIHQLSKRIMQLLPFTKALINGANQSKQSDSSQVATENNDTLDASQSSLNGLLGASKPNVSNVKAFLELLDSFKSELIKNEVTKNPSKETKPELGCCSTDVDKCDINSSLHTQNEDIVNNLTEANTGKIFYFESVPECHKFYSSCSQPKNPKEFLRRVKQEITVLQTSLPEGIFVTVFHDRMDLYSIMITGPKCTPYEDGLFIFDVQFPSGYPNVPPLVHYHSYCSDRLNPNLYESGKVCISLLGTWSGKGTEVWSSSSSNLLQVIISIQGLILVPEPYYNEAGYLKQRGTTLANENSRLYNEMVVLKLVQSMTKMLLSPYPVFERQIRQHIIACGENFTKRHENWVSLSEKSVSNSTNENISQLTQLKGDLILPQFPLLPASLGFCLTLNKALALFKDALHSIKS